MELARRVMRGIERCRIRLMMAKWKLFPRYQEALLVQARHLYRQSDLYRNRWNALDLDYAEAMFENDAQWFYHKARREPLRLRWQLFVDSARGKEIVPYYTEE